MNGDGRREIVGLDVVTAENGACWLAFLRGLRPRGLKGVELVISDAHPGLKDAVASVFCGAAWQRCRTHFIRTLRAFGRARVLAFAPRRQPLAAAGPALGRDAKGSV